MTRTSRWQRVFGAVAAAVAVLALNACGATAGGGGTASAAPGQKRANAADAQALVFAGCMRDNGVNMPDPGPGQQGLADAFQAVADKYDRATLQRALAACQDRMPQYPSQEQHPDDVMLALAECLRKQGLKVSDDPFNDAHSGAVDAGQFSRAMQVCRDVLIRGGQ